MPHPNVTIRTPGRSGQAAVRRALYLAVGWDDPPSLPPLNEAINHPDLLPYHEGWGRPGDLVVVAEASGEFIGAAFCRRFTMANHGYGFVDPDTPEVGIGVEKAHRGRGVGARLMNVLAERARAEGVSRMSLSVQNENPSRRLYERLGYHTLQGSGDATSALMVLELGPPRPESAPPE